MAKLAGSSLWLLLLVCAPLSFSQINGTQPTASLADRTPQVIASSDLQHAFLPAASSATIGAVETGKANLAMYKPVQPIAPITAPEPLIYGRKFKMLAAISAATMLADVELTAHCSCREVNPLYGSNPTRARLYGISVPLFAGQMMVSRMLRKKSPEGRLWMVPGASSSAAHMIGVAANLRAR